MYIRDVWKKMYFWQNNLTETEVGIMSYFHQQMVHFNRAMPFLYPGQTVGLKSCFQNHH